MAAARRCGPCCYAVGAEKPPARVAGVGCEAVVEVELEDNAGWRKRRGLSTARRNSRRRSTSWQQRRSYRGCSVAAEAPGKALLPRGRCEPHDLSKHVVLLGKLGTHVIMKSHMNVICFQYRSLLMCRWSNLGAPGTSRPAGSCRGSG
jgi:hypothetical protein